MAKSRFEYVKNFEIPDTLIPETFIIVRVDGRGFHKFSDAHQFEKPNDIPALELMNRAAKAVMDDLPDVILAFGESDEFSSIQPTPKINSTVCSIFTSAYVFFWSTYLPNRPLLYPPTFDSRVVLYPSAKEIRDYFSWRQADTHINNLYNTCFWALVKSGLSTRETNKELQGTDSKDKNEMLFSRFGINYNTLPEMFRKGSILVRVADDPGGPLTQPGCSIPTPPDSASQAGGGVHAAQNGTPESDIHASTPISTPSDGEAEPSRKMRTKKEKKPRPFEGLTGEVTVLHVDIIGEAFWNERPWLLSA